MPPQVKGGVPDTTAQADTTFDPDEFLKDFNPDEFLKGGPDTGPLPQQDTPPEIGQGFLRTHKEGQELLKTNPLAGSVKMLHAAWQMIPSMFGVGDWFMRHSGQLLIGEDTEGKPSGLGQTLNLPGQLGSFLLKAGPEAVGSFHNWAWKTAESELEAAGMDENTRERVKSVINLLTTSSTIDPITFFAEVQSFGLSGDQLKQLNDEVQSLKSTQLQYGIPILGAKLLPKVAGAVARGIIPETTPLSWESKAEGVPYKPKKGLEHFIDQLQSGIDRDYTPGVKGTRTMISDLQAVRDSFEKTLGRRTKEGTTVDFGFLNSTAKRLLDKYSAKVLPDGTRISGAMTADAHEIIHEQLETYSQLADQFPNRQVPLDIVNKWKEELYDIIGDKYGEKTDVQKSIAKGFAHDFLDGILEQAPELKKMGVDQGELIELTQMAQKQAARTLLRHKIRPSSMLRAAALGVVATQYSGSPIVGTEFGALGALGESIWFDPRFQHRMAVLLDKARKMGLDVPEIENLRPPTRRQGGTTPGQTVPGSPVGAPPSPLTQLRPAPTDASFVNIPKELSPGTSGQPPIEPTNYPVQKAISYEPQGEIKNRTGEVIGHEYKIKAPGHPADNANFSVLDGDDPLDKFRAKLKSFEEGAKKKSQK